ncbi:hypothetical protein [Pseudomonas sp. Fl4BN1]|uniref:hypothetical protein n=1 Tax=Pseudomonas sp. Fl4BN1 TaxID=2697651 RepID=UPI001377E679|nr:hypothetical protein [Pseudomonas sp. Fl4BN1]NBF11440.1 hypothetical protein [Pseudomonas sp. Fl4BN1]
MNRKSGLACVIGLLLLSSGCQSDSMPPPRVVAVGCQALPAPAAWFMEEREPNLTQRLLNDLSPLLGTVTKD